VVVRNSFLSGYP